MGWACVKHGEIVDMKNIHCSSYWGWGPLLALKPRLYSLMNKTYLIWGFYGDSLNIWSSCQQNRCFSLPLYIKGSSNAYLVNRIIFCLFILMFESEKTNLYCEIMITNNIEWIKKKHTMSEHFASVMVDKQQLGKIKGQLTEVPVMLCSDPIFLCLITQMKRYHLFL